VEYHEVLSEAKPFCKELIAEAIEKTTKLTSFPL